jgi:crotonobetainyl-CoA:carnitine CoA-transferase CaiB-like acyl-CoA transferase
MELFERWPGSKYADHARQNTELQVELREIFRTKTCAEWLDFANEVNTPIAPVNTPKNVVDDPQFRHRLPMYRVEDVGAEQLPLPVYVEGQLPPTPTMAPEIGEQTDEVLAGLGYDADRIADLRQRGVAGPRG